MWLSTHALNSMEVSLICVNNKKIPGVWLTGWRHQMETFSALLAYCDRWIPRTKSRDAELWCFLWSALLRKQCIGWWFEMLSRPLWRHRNGVTTKQFVSGHLFLAHKFPILKPRHSDVAEFYAMTVSEMNRLVSDIITHHWCISMAVWPKRS